MMYIPIPSIILIKNISSSHNLLCQELNILYDEYGENGVLAFDVKNEVAVVLRVPIPPGRYCVVTHVNDELSYVTVYNNCGDVFMLDMQGGMDMSLNRSVCVNLGDKKFRQTLE